VAGHATRHRRPGQSGRGQGWSGRWLAAATDYQTSVESALAANCAPLRQRDELAGLLSARGAQSADLARRGAYVSADAEQAAQRAKALLAERPCRLDEVAACVAQFDAAVSSLAQSTRQATIG